MILRWATLLMISMSRPCWAQIFSTSYWFNPGIAVKAIAALCRDPVVTKEIFYQQQLASLC